MPEGVEEVFMERPKFGASEVKPFQIPEGVEEVFMELRKVVV